MDFAFIVLTIAATLTPLRDPIFGTDAGLNFGRDLLWSNRYGLFDRFERRTAIRLDGEIIFPGGDAVAWREWKCAKSDGRVLVKSLRGAALVSKTALAERLERVPA